MTPAEELTAAADRLDALIAEATPGPWRLGIMYGSLIDGTRATVARDIIGQPDADYCVAMNPDVGRALAAHLRTAADLYVQIPASLLNVARAILGTQEDT